MPNGKDMNEIIKEALNEYFSDFKEYHLIILILFTIVISILQVGQSIWVSYRLENLKNSLKKSEIKFSRHNEMQIKALSESYQLLAKLQIIIENITLKESSNYLYSQWCQKYLDFLKHYKLNKFIYPINMDTKIPLILNNFEKMEMMLELKKKRNKMFKINNEGGKDCLVSFDEVEHIDEELREINQDQTRKFVLENLKDLKKDIEAFFNRLE